MEALDIAACAAGSTEALMVVRVDSVTAATQGPYQVPIAPAMFAQTVKDKDDSSCRSFRTPPAVEYG